MLSCVLKAGHHTFQMCIVSSVAIKTVINLPTPTPKLWLFCRNLTDHSRKFSNFRSHRCFQCGRKGPNRPNKFIIFQYKTRSLTRLYVFANNVNGNAKIQVVRFVQCGSACRRLVDKTKWTMRSLNKNNKLCCPEKGYTVQLVIYGTPQWIQFVLCVCSFYSKLLGIL